MNTGLTRILPFGCADGPHNMAADEVLLNSAVGGLASIRVYTWSVPTVSLGYFQRNAERLGDPKFAGLPWVRRATGGGAILHDGDLTYAITLPKTLAKRYSPSDWHCRIHRIIAQFLRDHEMTAEVVGQTTTSSAGRDFDCFAVPQTGDVVLAGRKIIGGAQRLRAGALLQHGSIQVANSHLLRDGLPGHLASALQGPMVCQDWTNEERNSIEQLAVYKYSQDSWNGKR